MQRRRQLMAMQSKSQIVNLCPAATGTEIVQNWTAASGSFRYTVTGLDPTQDYTLQVTITESWDCTTGRRLYCYADTPSGSYIDTAESSVPIIKTITRKPTQDGKLTISHNRVALLDEEYAASLTNIMLEIGSVAHPYVPYIGS